MIPERDGVFSPAEVCEFLGISPITLWRERKAGRISYRRVASKVLFTREDIEEYLERNKQSATKPKEQLQPCR